MTDTQNNPHTFEPQLLVEDLFRMASDTLNSQNAVPASMFFPTPTGRIAVTNINDLLDNNDSKKMASLIPAYFGHLNGGLPIFAMLTEAWVADMSAQLTPDMTDADKKAVVEAMFEQYGSISNMPAHLLKEVVLLHLTTPEGEQVFTWDLKRDIHGQAHLLDGDKTVDFTRDKPPIHGHFHNTYALYQKLDALLVNIKHNIPPEDHERAMGPITVKLSERDKVPHHMAYMAAKKVFDNILQDADAERATANASAAFWQVIALAGDKIPYPARDCFSYTLQQYDTDDDA